MNDDSLTPEAELASATLDNEVTEDERALVTESPSLRDELAFYADLRSRLADVAVPAEARESALAAALAVFDETNATQSDVEPELAAAVAATKVAAIAPVVSLHERRQRQYRWIGGAAAAAVVAVLAVGVLGNLGGESRDESSAPALKVSDESDQTEDAAAAPPEIASAQAGETAESVASDAAPSAAATEAAGDSANDELGEIGGPAEVSAWYAVPQLDTDDDVIAFVISDPFAQSSTPPASTRTGDASSETTAAAETSPAPATTVVSAATTASNDTEAASTGSGPDSSTECPQLAIGPFARAVYQGREVYVVVDDANGEVLVVDRISCDVDRRIRLP